jgi:hypothetical protein
MPIRLGISLLVSGGTTQWCWIRSRPSRRRGAPKPPTGSSGADGVRPSPFTRWSSRCSSHRCICPQSSTSTRQTGIRSGLNKLQGSWKSSRHRCWPLRRWRSSTCCCGDGPLPPPRSCSRSPLPSAPRPGSSAVRPSGSTGLRSCSSSRACCCSPARAQLAGRSRQVFSVASLRATARPIPSWRQRLESTVFGGPDACTSAGGGGHAACGSVVGL